MRTERDARLARARAQRTHAEQLQRDPAVDGDARKPLRRPEGNRAEERGRGERQQRAGEERLPQRTTRLAPR